MIRYAVLYFTLLVVFVALLVGPAVGGKFIISESTVNSLNNALPAFPLVQPNNNNLKDNTRGRNETGTGSPGYTGPGTASRTEAAAKETDSSSNGKFRFL